jgi:hypothetical protein
MWEKEYNKHYNLLTDSVIRWVWHWRTYGIFFMVVQFSIVICSLVLLKQINCFVITVCLLSCCLGVLLSFCLVVFLNTHIYCFASWTVHFVNIWVKNQQIHQLFIQFINNVWQLLHVSALHCHRQGVFLVPSERCWIEEQSIEYCGWAM